MATEVPTICPSGTTRASIYCTSGEGRMTTATCPSGYILVMIGDGKCVLKSSITSKPECIAYNATVTDAAIAMNQPPMPPPGSEICGASADLFPPWLASMELNVALSSEGKFTQAAHDAALAYKNGSTSTPAASSSSDIPSYETIKSQYAGYAVESDVSTQLKKVADSLKNRKVQPDPSPDLKRQILNPLDLSVIQTVLFSILLAMLMFIVLPSTYASYTAFLTLCVGASVGIYLSTR